MTAPSSVRLEFDPAVDRYGKGKALRNGLSVALRKILLQHLHRLLPPI